MGNKGRSIGTIFAEIDLDSSSYTKKQKEILSGAKVTVLDIEKNWRTIGSSSDKMYEAMRQNITNAYNQIANSAKSSANDILRAEREKNARIEEINKKQYGEHVSMIDKLKSHWAELAASAYLAFKAFQMGGEMINAALQMERINISMNAVTDNTTLAAREVQYLREESERLGLVFSDATVEYVKFAAAAKNTSIEGEATRKIFTGVSEAITALKLSTMDANLIYMAMTQMISKGKVSMEELRRQMGERLPGAIRLAAEGMGMTTMELIKQIEAGKVMATDLLPKLAEQLHKTYGQAAIEAAQSGQAAINRYHNTMFETKAIIGQALMPAFTDLLNLIRQGVPYAGMFAIGFKLAVVDVAASVDKVVYYFRNIKTFMFGSPEEVAKLRANMKETFAIYDEAAEATKKSIYGAGVPSQKTANELALEAMKTDLARKNEVVKDPDAKVKAAKSEADKILKIQQDANMAIAKHRETATKEYEKLLTNETDFALTENERQIAQIERQELDKLWKLNVMLQEETITWEQYEKAKTAVTANAAKARLANETENAKRIASINYNLVQDIIGMEETAFNLRMGMIEAEKKKYVADGGDIVYAARWAADQQLKAIIDLGKKSGNIVDGMRSGFLEFYRDSQRMGQESAAIVMKSFNGMTDTLTDFITEGKADFKGLINSILKDITRLAVKSAITGPLSKALSGLFDFGSTAAASSGVIAENTARMALIPTLVAEEAARLTLTATTMAQGTASAALTAAIAAEEAGKVTVTATTMAQDVAEITLTATLAAETGVVTALTAAYIALAAAKMMAGMGGGGGAGFSFFHKGGIVGETAAPTRELPAPMLLAAPRLHSGLASDEFPAILQRGETVIPKGKRAATIHNHYYQIAPVIKGSVITAKGLAREMVPLIKQATKEGAH